MTVEVKICGISDVQGANAVAAAGAHYAGFVFYQKSPRFVGASQASSLVGQLTTAVKPVGLFVDPQNDDILRIMRTVPLRVIQLHGSETPERIVEIKELARLPVIKAVSLDSANQIASIRPYEAVADFLLFDARPLAGELPGGNARAFDWTVLKNAGFTKPWFLAGGLHEGNVGEAILASGAKMVDVSSGVEDSLGRKSPAKIKAFIEAAQKEAR